MTSLKAKDIDKRRFILIVEFLFILTVLSAITASIIFFPRIQSIETVEDLSIAAEQLAKSNTELTAKIDKLRLEKEELSKQTVSKELRDQLEILEKKAGIKEFDGNTLSIILNDNLQNGSFETQALCHGANLRDIVNLLKLPQLQVEAISINGIRIHLQSTIHCFSDGTSIGTTKTFAPYTIEVVGDNEQIINHLKTRTLIPEIWKQIDNKIITLEVIQHENKTLPTTLSRPQGNYLNPINE